METIDIAALQQLADRVIPNTQSKENMNVYLNEDFLSKMSEFPYTTLYDFFDCKNNPNIVDTIFTLLGAGSKGDLTIESGTKLGRHVLYCKVEVDDRGGPWGFSLTARSILKDEYIYNVFKEFIKTFVESTIFKHLHSGVKSCVYFTYELVPGKAIIYLD